MFLSEYDCLTIDAELLKKFPRKSRIPKGGRVHATLAIPFISNEMRMRARCNEVPVP
jgi:hypothetical protein